MPLTFWWESFHTASFLINRMLTPVLNNISPFTKLHGRKPNYTFLKTFGCSCFPFLRSYSKHKFNFHTEKCLMIGYSPMHKGYKCLNSAGKVYVARHVQFNESEFPYSALFSPSHKITPDLSLIQHRHSPFSTISFSTVSHDSGSTQTSSSSPDLDVTPNSSHSHTSSVQHFPMDNQSFLDQSQ